LTREPNFPIFHAGASLLLAVGGIMVDLLKGIRIVSFTHFLFGPTGVQALTDLAADVITIEPLRGSWQRGCGEEDNAELSRAPKGHRS
jgi:crotonobetainyl-CoA:carnitine CoA-transferase CaiB-like acyl-CoA transferase